MIWALALGSPLVARSSPLLTETGVPRLSRNKGFAIADPSRSRKTRCLQHSELALRAEIPSLLRTSIYSSGAGRRARTRAAPPTRSVHRVSRRRSAKVGLAGHEQQGPGSFECFQISQAVK